VDRLSGAYLATLDKIKPGANVSLIKFGNYPYREGGALENGESENNFAKYLETVKEGYCGVYNHIKKF